MNILSLIGRTNELFSNDINNHEKELSSNFKFLVTGEAVFIGSATTEEISNRNF